MAQKNPEGAKINKIKQGQEETAVPIKPRHKMMVVYVATLVSSNRVTAGYTK